MSTHGFELALEAVGKLVADFRANYDFFLSTAYSEAQLRKDFIDKFFIALGWDVNNERHPNPFEREVKVEKPVADGAAGRRADYAFYIAPNFRDPRFIAEAKKPYGEIATADNYFQAVRYGWNLQNPLAGLTDFEHFHLLDCRYKPNIGTAIHCCVEKWSLDDYGDREQFARLYWLISHEAVTNGSLEKFTAGLPKPRGKGKQRGLPAGAPKRIDEAFLEDLDLHRNTLARAFKKHNPDLDSEILTEITQRALDRLVFMRFLEDKLIEPARFVESFGQRGTAWQDFVTASRRLDRIYNGIVFKKHATLDSSDFRLDDAAFAGVCEDLSHRDSPYDFNAIPIHILGSIYERFLGNIIVATDKRVRVEQKPEVRKAGGVFYTPEYIVNYIVENTVGKLIAGKTPHAIANMRFADIACGSGSFLIGVFDLLLRYHATYYNTHRRKASKGDCISRDGALHLTVEKKREILLNNIYGVDVDSQAVEVTQLSLYLKLLDEETIASTHDYQLKMHAAILPPLDKNIVCGNSLIERNVSNGNLFADEHEREINPMNFEDSFPDVVKQGGFDAILGNPPYVRIQGFPKEQISYLTKHYRSATGNCDLYVSFVERAFALLKAGGHVGYIVPNKFLRTDYGVGLRRVLAAESALSELIDFGANQVFDATTYTCLMFLHKAQNKVFRYAQSEATPEALLAPSFAERLSESLDAGAWRFENEAAAKLTKKLSAKSLRLLDLPCEMSRGSSTGDDDSFVVDRSAKIEKQVLRVPLFATDFKRFILTPTDEWRIIFPYEVGKDDVRLFTESELKRRFPKAYDHLKGRQPQLRMRKQFAEWFAFSAPRNLLLHDRAQIAIPLLGERGSFAMIPPDARGRLCPMASGGFTITLAPGAPVSAPYVLGLLNSKLLFWSLRQMSNIFRGGWITCTKQYFGELPIVLPDPPRHDRMVRLVEQILDAKLRIAASRTHKDIDYYTSKCESLDRRIDELVYELYGLSEKEIRIVEEANS